MGTVSMGFNPLPIVSIRSPMDSTAAGEGLPGSTARGRSYLVRLADGQVAAVGSGDRASDQKQVVRRVDADDLEVPHRDPGVAVLARLLDSLAGVGRIGAG